MLLKIKICCDITPCPLLNSSRRFERNILPSFWVPIRPRAWILGCLNLSVGTVYVLGTAMTLYQL